MSRGGKWRPSPHVQESQNGGRFSPDLDIAADPIPQRPFSRTTGVADLNYAIRMDRLALTSPADFDARDEDNASFPGDTSGRVAHGPEDGWVNTASVIGGSGGGGGGSGGAAADGVGAGGARSYPTAAFNKLQVEPNSPEMQFEPLGPDNTGNNSNLEKQSSGSNRYALHKSWTFGDGERSLGMREREVSDSEQLAAAQTASFNFRSLAFDMDAKSGTNRASTSSPMTSDSGVQLNATAGERSKKADTESGGGGFGGGGGPDANMRQQGRISKSSDRGREEEGMRSRSKSDRSDREREREKERERRKKGGERATVERDERDKERTVDRVANSSSVPLNTEGHESPDLERDRGQERERGERERGPHSIRKVITSPPRLKKVKISYCSSRYLLAISPSATRYSTALH